MQDLPKRKGKEESPQEKGRRFEQTLAKKYQFQIVPNSGAGKFFKLDLRGKQLLVSCKWTGAESYRLTKSDIDEVSDAIRGPGGLGGGTVPLMIVSVGGYELACLPLDDLIGLLKEDAKLIPVSNTEQKYAEAATPSLLRE